MIGFVYGCPAILGWVPASAAPWLHNLICAGVTLLGPFAKWTAFLGRLLVPDGFGVTGWVLDPP